jgi:WD40 repeat protein
MKKFKLGALALTALLALMPSLQAQPDLPPGIGRRLPASMKNVRSLQISPDGKWLAATFTVTRRQEQTNTYLPARASMQVWDARTGQPKWDLPLEGNFNLTILFSPDSSRLLFTKLEYGGGENAWNDRKYVAELRDAATGKVLAALELEGQEWYGQLFFAPDGKQIVGNSSRPNLREAAGPGRGVVLWDIATGKKADWRAGLLPLESITAFSSDGQRVLTQATEFNTKEEKIDETRLAVRSWPGLELLGTVSLAAVRAGNLTISRDGSRVAMVKFQTKGYQSTNEFETLVWHVKDDKLVPVELPAAANYSVSTLEFLPDGTTVMGSGRGFHHKGFPQTELWFWNAQSGELERVLTEEEMGFRGFGFSQHTLLAPQERMFFRATREATVELRSLEDGALIRTYSEKDNPQ